MSAGWLGEADRQGAWARGEVEDVCVPCGTENAVIDTCVYVWARDWGMVARGFICGVDVQGDLLRVW